MTFLAMLGKALKWALGRPRLTAEAFLIGLLVIGGWRYNRAQEALKDARAESGELEDGLQEQLRLKDGELEILRRENGRVIREVVYIPPEGSVVITKKDLKVLRDKYEKLLKKLAEADSEEERERIRRELEGVADEIGDPTETKIKDKGFLWPPKWGGGAEWGNRGVQLRLGAKWGFWKRYSLITGGSKLGLDIGGSRHLDDLIWGRPRNVELWGGYKFVRFDGGQMWAVGIRSNF